MQRRWGLVERCHERWHWLDKLTRQVTKATSHSATIAISVQQTQIRHIPMHMLTLLLMTRESLIAASPLPTSGPQREWYEPVVHRGDGSGWILSSPQLFLLFGVFQTSCQPFHVCTRIAICHLGAAEWFSDTIYVLGITKRPLHVYNRTSKAAKLALFVFPCGIR